MNKHTGYVWAGMKHISVEEAKSILEGDGSVYRLYDDNTESLVDDLSELDPNGEYGIDFEDEVALETHYKPNADESGFVGK